MAERLIEKLDRLGAEAGIKQMTPEVYRFALDVRKDLVSEWPKRPWVGLTDEEIEDAIDDGFAFGLNDGNVSNEYVIRYARVIEAKLRSKNNG
jgi:hypothetical protein